MSERPHFRVMLDRVEKTFEIPMAADAAESPLRLGDPGGGPAHDHRAVAPPLDVACEAADEAVHVLDSSGGHTDRRRFRS